MRRKCIVNSHYALAEILHRVELLDLPDYIVASTEDMRETLYLF